MFRFDDKALYSALDTSLLKACLTALNLPILNTEPKDTTSSSPEFGRYLLDPPSLKWSYPFGTSLFIPISVNLSNFGWAISDSKLTDCIVAIMNIARISLFQTSNSRRLLFFESETPTPSGLNLKASGSGETNIGITDAFGSVPNTGINAHTTASPVNSYWSLKPLVCLNLLINCTAWRLLILLSASCSVCSK